ncbi:hypothetical protein QFC21_003013 [Naganishia friedmannii]|uniref:Uncharacterized protein n=1 Tax=Naganishia friedmannii TaxID=89922 RepID=A0ACC2VRJ7_9TREE|nr:hypothetical protein QFC21_003013 [Naganishia friedmannii]
MPAAVLLFEWFQQRRGIASGIMYAGTGAGGTVFPFIVRALLNSFGYKAAMISLGVGFFVIGAIAIIPVKPRVPTGRARSDLGVNKPDGTTLLAILNGSAAACLLLWGFSTNAGVLIAFVIVFGLLGLSFSAISAKLVGIVARPVSEALLKSPVWKGAAGAYGFKNYGALLLYTGITMLAGYVAGIAYKDSD